MPFDIYVSERPRTLAVVPRDNLTGQPRSMLVLEHKRKRETLSHYLAPVNAMPIIGILGLLHVANELFLGVVSHSQLVGQVSSHEQIYRVISVRFYSLTTSVYDSIADYYSYNEGTSNPLQHPCDNLSKYLSGGAFYYSINFDLTKNMAASLGAYDASVLESDRPDTNFFWNGHMLGRLLEYCDRTDSTTYQEMSQEGMFLNLIQGYVGITESWHGGSSLKLALISRISCKRAGARFQTRGLDDDGNVANYVETELVVVTKEFIRCYVQVRGNVPAFWEQQGLQIGAHRVQITRNFTATKEALKKHVNHDLERFDYMHAINLLSEVVPGEATLSDTFERYLGELGYDNISMKNFDFNFICKNGNLANSRQLIGQIESQIRNFGFYTYDLKEDSWVTRQTGIFRTNCMDWTNVAQGLISNRILENILDDMPEWSNKRWQLLAQHSEQWAENGDALSRVYAGTNALKSSFTRKGKSTFAGLLSDASKSLTRMYNSTFQDKQKQETIDQLLGKLVYQKQVIIYDPMSELIQTELQLRSSEYVKNESILLWTGTFNVNGQEPIASIRSWIKIDGNHPPDMLVVAFQEVVSLTPQQFVSANETNRHIWEELALEEANEQLTNGDVYINLRSGQLVGVALIVMILKRHVKKIKQVEMAMKKTGLGGVSGNKGAVAIRLTYLDAGFCFVSGHFASGQSNYMERIGDYNAIEEGLLFANGRHIQDHKNVFWLGDFNFRVDLMNEDVRYLIEQDHLQPLLDQDQLRKCMERQEVFRGFTEGQITFPPTYKFDLGTNIYDTSEKARIPAWTDRILYRGKRIHQLEYSRTNLRISDHRPGVDAPALERVRTNLVEQILSTETSSDTYQSLKRQTIPNKHTVSHAPLISFDADHDDKESASTTNSNNSVNSHDTGLPPPSSSTQQWWNQVDIPSKETLYRTHHDNPFDSDTDPEEETYLTKHTSPKDTDPFRDI
ncbi:SacI homology domain-containing protein [Syncephalis fuscata]|nr:SacI homology domain-containing protein [Syncephalis fuscata]